MGTGRGRAVIVEAVPRHVEAVNRLVLYTLTAAQACQLRAIVGRILDAVDVEGGMTPKPGP